MRTSEILITIAAFFIIVAGMRAAAVIVVPFLLAAFIAIISSGPLFWLQRKKIPTVLALLIVVGGILCVFSIIGMMVGTSVKDFTKDLPIYQDKLRLQTATIFAWLEVHGIDSSVVALDDYFNPMAAMNLVATLLNSFGNVLTNGFLILMTVVFMLLEASSFPAKLSYILGSPDRPLARFDRFFEEVNHYMAIKTLICIATGIVMTIWLTILGVDYALLWGLLAFALNYIPNIGSIIAAVPPFLLAIVQLGFGRAIAVAVGYLVVNLMIGNLIEPRVMGRGLGLSTLVVFLSLLFWGWILGPVGMFLSVPLTITAKIALDGRSDTKWAAILLGSDVPGSAAKE